MYTVGSIADIISGKNTPNKPSVEIKEVQASPFKSKKTPKKDISEKQEQIVNTDILEKQEKTPKKQKNTPKKRKTSEGDATEEIQDASPLKTPKKRKAESENNEESKKKKDNQEPGDTVPKKHVSENTKGALKRIKKKKKDSFVNPDQDERTIFVGNIPLTTNKKEILKFFGKYGKIQSVRFRSVARPDLKTPKRAAFIKKQFHPKATSINCYVVFTEKECAHKALEANGQIFKEKHIRVDLIRKEIDHNQKQAIFVGNVPFDAKDEDLWSIFESCGRVDSVRLVRDGLTGVGKGYGYINFDSTDAVELAIQMPEVKINNRILRIKRSVACFKQSKKRDEKGEKIRQVPRKPKHANRVRKESNTANDDAPTEIMETVDESDVKEELVEKPKKKKIPKESFQGVKFTDKKKKKKTNKTLLKKKKMSKILAPKKKNT